MEVLGNLRGHNSEHEQTLDVVILSFVIELEGLLDFLVGEGSREGDEADVARVFFDGQEGAFVEGFDGVDDVLNGVDIEPDATFALTGASIGVLLDEDVRLREVREKNFDHLFDESGGSFLGELSNEDAESSLVAVANARHAVVAEGICRAEGALPRNLAFGGFVDARFDVSCGSINGDEGRNAVLFKEFSGFRLGLHLVLRLLLLLRFGDRNLFLLLLRFRERACLFRESLMDLLLL